MYHLKVSVHTYVPKYMCHILYGLWDDHGACDRQQSRSTGHQGVCAYISILISMCHFHRYTTGTVVISVSKCPLLCTMDTSEAVVTWDKYHFLQVDVHMYRSICATYYINGIKDDPLVTKVCIAPESVCIHQYSCVITHVDTTEAVVTSATAMPVAPPGGWGGGA